MKDWICVRCGQEVSAEERPEPIRWTDGHVCRFVQNEERPERCDVCDRCLDSGKGHVGEEVLVCVEHGVRWEDSVDAVRRCI